MDIVDDLRVHLDDLGRTVLMPVRYRYVQRADGRNRAKTEGRSEGDGSAARTPPPAIRSPAKSGGRNVP